MIMEILMFLLLGIHVQRVTTDFKLNPNALSFIPMSLKIADHCSADNDLDKRDPIYGREPNTNESVPGIVITTNRLRSMDLASLGIHTTLTCIIF